MSNLKRDEDIEMSGVQINSYPNCGDSLDTVRLEERSSF